RRPARPSPGPRSQPSSCGLAACPEIPFGFAPLSTDKSQKRVSEKEPQNARSGGPEGLPDLTQQPYVAACRPVKSPPARKNALLASFCLEANARSTTTAGTPTLRRALRTFFSPAGPLAPVFPDPEPRPEQ